MGLRGVFRLRWGRWLAVALVGAALAGIVALTAGALGTGAAKGDFSLDFIAADEHTFNHLTAVETSAGSLQYDARAIGTYVREELEAVDWQCGDTIIFFTQVVVDPSATDTNQTIDITYRFDAHEGGSPLNPKVGYTDILAAGISKVNFPSSQTQETGNINLDANESVALTSESVVGGTLGVDADYVEGVVRVTGLDPGDTLIVRVDVLFSCFGGAVSDANANVQARLAGATNNGQNISVGQQTVPMIGFGKVPTATNTPTSTPTETPMPTNTPMPTDTPTSTPTETPTLTNIPTDTPTPTNTPTNTPTKTPIPTDTPTETPIPTDTPTATPTDTSTPIPTDTPTETPIPTDTPTETPIPTDTPTETPIPTDTPTATPTDTSTPIPTDTPTPTQTAAPIATETPTGTPPTSTAVPSATGTPPTAVPTATGTPPTATPTIVPTSTAIPTSTPPGTLPATATSAPLPTAANAPLPTSTRVSQVLPTGMNPTHTPVSQVRAAPTPVIRELPRTGSGPGDAWFPWPAVLAGLLAAAGLTVLVSALYRRLSDTER
jgi:hypothetical protein